jgi:hypothetical protein
MQLLGGAIGICSHSTRFWLHIETCGMASYAGRNEEIGLLSNILLTVLGYAILVGGTLLMATHPLLSLIATGVVVLPSVLIGMKIIPFLWKYES